ncbi:MULTISPECIES: aspartate 1-decarboxylase autocleavage activator PanM [Providencia]|uniref:aspartate 1-decarboxylase autocleavage activator PanM n=1 Tax=Providencia TaxID=586 RepID=UPI0018C6B319|nr:MULTISPECIES: aspartate 1-decarboxylase autocleavage activator PanM [Providencia]ELR5121198.1 aspartate 1-decarboxylase autocleavage activator PanM [Providencia stuartii]ELZ5938767.1 aspartate 1-decarboxylase autocleavage activator PanM [Providencia stuartii]MBG5919717.1 aspartate 1-decarboxylase autocleavage activator PanM [Providencia stuartii]MCK1142437.1 aspartate 1-decarboxylase autocleavage activator PanM [Providencia stuartii]WBA57624.1 aspartate 1-decarboxylase autocleavage activato
MKLTIIPVVDPTDQQYLDLYKIWPDQNQHQIQTLLQSGEKIYAARFNDRLLAAAKMKVDHQQGTIYHFLVREVTRRRGVGLYLLNEICRQEAQVTHWGFSLKEIDEEQKAVMTSFLFACGFTPTPENDLWEKRM